MSAVFWAAIPSAYSSLDWVDLAALRTVNLGSSFTAPSFHWWVAHAASCFSFRWSPQPRLQSLTAFIRSFGTMQQMVDEPFYGRLIDDEWTFGNRSPRDNLIRFHIADICCMAGGSFAD